MVVLGVRKSERASIRSSVMPTPSFSFTPIDVDTTAGGIDRGGGHALHEGLDAAREIELVKGELHGGLIGRAILEPQFADARLDRIRRED